MFTLSMTLKPAACSSSSKFFEKLSYRTILFEIYAVDSISLRKWAIVAARGARTSLLYMISDPNIVSNFPEIVVD